MAVAPLLVAALLVAALLVAALLEAALRRVPTLLLLLRRRRDRGLGRVAALHRRIAGDVALRGLLLLLLRQDRGLGRVAALHRRIAGDVALRGVEAAVRLRAAGRRGAVARLADTAVGRRQNAARACRGVAGRGGPGPHRPVELLLRLGLCRERSSTQVGAGRRRRQRGPVRLACSRIQRLLLLLLLGQGRVLSLDGELWLLDLGCVGRLLAWNKELLAGERNLRLLALGYVGRLLALDKVLLLLAWIRVLACLTGVEGLLLAVEWGLDTATQADVSGELGGRGDAHHVVVLVKRNPARTQSRQPGVGASARHYSVRVDSVWLQQRKENTPVDQAIPESNHWLPDWSQGQLVLSACKSKHTPPIARLVVLRQNACALPGGPRLGSQIA